jgi:hypothetical protein
MDARYGERELTVQTHDLVHVTNVPTHKRWFIPAFAAYWREVYRQADYWARLNAANNARKRAAKVAEKSAA